VTKEIEEGSLYHWRQSGPLERLKDMNGGGGSSCKSKQKIADWLDTVDEIENEDHFRK
jgi:hypothetical protein